MTFSHIHHISLIAVFKHYPGIAKMAAMRPLRTLRTSLTRPVPVVRLAMAAFDPVWTALRQDFSAPSNALAAATVTNVNGAGGNGWWFRWICRDNPGSGFGVFVNIDGTADYTEGAECVSGA